MKTGPTPAIAAEDPPAALPSSLADPGQGSLLTLLSDISQGATDADDLGALVALVVRGMQAHLGVVRGGITLVEPGAALPDHGAAPGPAAGGGGWSPWIPGEDLIRFVVESGQALIRPLHHGAPEGVAPSTLLCVPILSHPKVLGVLGAEVASRPRGALAQDVDVLRILAAIIAPAVERSLRQPAPRPPAPTARFRPANIIGVSPPMLAVYDLIQKVAQTKATVLILGESGVGKELVAAAIHANSQSAQGPFVTFNCAALPESLIESELFGHEKGAFTGAIAQRKGRFELADGGTLFLDEVGELSLPMQAKLLRVLQDKTFERVGGQRPVRVDVRIIAATNRNVARMVETKTFRDDLYYRLNVFPLTLPPLRERGHDVVLLANHFIQRHANALGCGVKRLSPAALALVRAYSWPGNVRELENVMERAVILSDDGVIHSHALPPALQAPEATGAFQGGTLATKLDAVERALILEALQAHHGNITEAARHLGLTRRILGLRLEKHALSYKAFRKGGVEPPGVPPRPGQRRSAIRSWEAEGARPTT